MKLLEKIPALIAALCLTIYWGAVLVKLVKVGRKIGKDPNALPREPIGQLMRLVWYPNIVIMLAQAWIGVWPPESIRNWTLAPWLRSLWWAAESPSPPTWWWIAAGSASLLGCAGTIFTFVCWRRMGRSWRIGIDPGETLELVSAGPYQYVRHPIYATRMVIDVAAWIMVPTEIMALTVLVDIVFMVVEARREEQYMLATNGAAYRSYMNRVGRFWPHTRGKNTVPEQR